MTEIHDRIYFLYNYSWFGIIKMHCVRNHLLKHVSDVHELVKCLDFRS